MAITSRAKYGPRGLAKVTVTDEKIKVQFEETRDTFEVFREDAPEYKITDGKYIVSMDSDCMKIMNIIPPKGTYFGRFSHFWHKQDELPIYRSVAAKTGRKKDGGSFFVPSHLEFTAVFSITSKDYEGFEVPYIMWYCFEPGKIDPFESDIVGKGRQKVEDFLMAAGFDVLTDSIPYSENVLPELEKMVLSKKAEVAITINLGGWVDDITSAPSR